MKRNVHGECMEKEVKVSLPQNWAFCFNNRCVMAETCMRRFSTGIVGKEREVGMTVFTDAAAEGKCRWYREKRIASMAWGLQEAFTKVLYKDAAPIRRALMEILGGKGGYYRYNRGEKRLTPEKQEAVMKVFGSFGYHDIAFDHYEDEYLL